MEKQENEFSGFLFKYIVICGNNFIFFKILFYILPISVQ